MVVCLIVDLATIDSFHLFGPLHRVWKFLLCTSCLITLYMVYFDDNWFHFFAYFASSLLTIHVLLLYFTSEKYMNFELSLLKCLFTSSILQVIYKKKLMMGPFCFARVPISRFWVHSSSSWIMDRLSHKEQKAIWFSSGLKLSFVLGLFYCLISIELKC
jgi:hypothetical protein